jgi:hypothetical protein
MKRTVRRCGPPPAPTRTRTLDARPTRLSAAGLALITLTAALLLVWAASAHASVWVIPAMSRAYPTSKPGAHQSIAIDAAGNEYQGVQVCLRGGQRTVRLSWSADSDPVIVGNAKLFRVYYVKVTRPTTNLGSRPGWYPDPLVPRDFGASMSVPGSVNPGPTTPFYILVHVPYGTPAGTYTATLHVENGAEVKDVPFSLRVWNFGWTELGTRSAFATSFKFLQASVAGHVKMNADNKRRLLVAFYGMMHEHGIAPSMLGVVPSVSSSGHVAAGAFANTISPYLDAGGVGLPDTQLPWVNWFPWSRGGYSPGAAKLDTYLTEMARLYQSRGWQDKAYTYILDETTTTSQERLAEKYARVVHRASARSGYRLRFLLTDDPRPTNLGGVKHANTFLYNDVDIWALRYYYFFGRIPAVRERQSAGKKIWWYTYTNASVRRIPAFVIDKPHIDERTWGWLMEQWGVEGILNWGFDRWGDARTGRGWRDPYRYPLSLVRGNVRSNGCTCLVYPGYYPRYGLKDPYAAPVSSLRLEALRDGLEEREYLRLAKGYGVTGKALAKTVLATITWYPYKIRQANTFNFPKYTHTNSVFDRARLQLAAFVEAQQP